MKSINVLLKRKFKLFLFVTGSVCLFAFQADQSFKNDYVLPIFASAVCTGDINLDDDIDIVVGHTYNSDNEWGGVSILLNDG